MKNWILIASLPAVALSTVALNSLAQPAPETTTTQQTQPAQDRGPDRGPRGEERGPRDGDRGPRDADRGPGGRGGPMDRGGPDGPMGGPGGPMGGPGGPMGGPGGPMGGPGGPMGRDGPGPGGPGGRGGPNHPMDMRRPPTMDTQRGYMTLVAGYVELSKDSTAAGVASVLTAADVLKPRGNSAAIEYFNNLLGSVKDPAIDRAIRLQLVDLYRATNQSDEALKHLEKLISAEPTAK